MKDIATTDLCFEHDRASVPAEPASSGFESWLAGRAELWNAGSGIQQEMFARATRARLAR